MSETKDAFVKIYEQNLFFGRESISGPGSGVAATVKLRAELSLALRQLGVRRLIDAPCGDMNWMRHLNFGLDLYVGIDIVPDIIATLRHELSSEVYRFQVGDLCEDILPMGDALLVRDCLVHLPYERIRSAVSRFKLSGTRFLMTTTFPEHENVDIPIGRWRPLNLEREPFCWPAPLRTIVEGVPDINDPWNDKSLGIWCMSTLP